MIVGLTSDGASIQKGTLRIGGALVGAAMGFLAILFVTPRMESIASLALLVAAGTAVAAWVVAGSPRIAYAGVQIAFAFYVCVIQGFEPTWYFYTIRDRLVGILLGNMILTLVFQYVWPVRASTAMWKSVASGLRAMARLATLASSEEDPSRIATQAHALRLDACHDFAVAQQLGDEAAFELGGGDPDVPGLASAAEREHLQRTTADAQAVFLTQLAVVQQRTNSLSGELPPVLVRAAREFDAIVSQSLGAIADQLDGGVRRLVDGGVRRLVDDGAGRLVDDGAGRLVDGGVRRLDGSVPRALPDLRAALAAVTAIAEAATGTLRDRETAAQIAGRLALYREITRRIGRLEATGLAR
jgi:hypothetical protein